MLVEVQSLQERGDANSARIEIDYQSEAGNHVGIRDLGDKSHCPWYIIMVKLI